MDLLHLLIQKEPISLLDSGEHLAHAALVHRYFQTFDYSCAGLESLLVYWDHLDLDYIIVACFH